MKKFFGTGVALVTPFNKKNEIDFQALGKIIDFDIYEILRDFQTSSKAKNIKLTLKGININKI